MKLKYYLLIIVSSLILGFSIAVVLRSDLIGYAFGKKSVDATSLVDYQSVCTNKNISNFSTGFPFSAYKDCACGYSGTYCNHRSCSTFNYGDMSVIFNGFFWSFIVYIVLRVVFNKSMTNKELTKKAVLVYGIYTKELANLPECNPNNEVNWMGWTKKELKKQGYEVVCPVIPKVWQSTYADWKKELDKINIDEYTVMVGLSAGAGAITKF